MANISFHKEVTTPEALASTIDTDHYVLGWFVLLIAQPAVRLRAIEDPEIPPFYAAFKRIVAGQYLLYILLWGGLFTVLYLKHYSDLWLVLLLLLPIFYLHVQLKKNVKAISMNIVLKDFDPATLRQKTLYQISEFYSRQYHIPSIVDNIFALDNATRIAVIALAILAGQMIPLIIKVYRVNFISTFLVLLAACGLIFMTIYTFIIYKYLQNFPPRKTS